MNTTAIFVLLLIGLCFQIPAQEDVLDPSIFDGTGRELEKTDPASASPATPAPDETEPGSGGEPQAPALSLPPTASAEETPATEAPREIVLPGKEAQTETSEAPNGTPANSNAQESRAGERVESTEKIAPGQAVDYPWDM